MKTSHWLVVRATPLSICVSALLLGAVGRADAAGDAAAGRKKASACEVCHGLDGKSKLPDTPNLAGQLQDYLTRQLNAFKKGDRKNDIMSAIVSTLSAQDIEDVAAYYAAIEITIGKIPGK
jgi:cytochrome c553